MSEQAARSWLSSHQTSIPALEIHHRQALDVLQDHAKTVHDLADVVSLDPGMTISVFQQVNSLLQQSGKERVDSVHAALSLLGDSAIADMIQQHRVLETTHPDETQRRSYRQLVSRSYHMQAQLDAFMKIQGITSVHDMRCAALLHCIGEYLACLSDFKHYQQYEIKFRIMGSEANSAKPVFGFDFHELGRIQAVHDQLPELIEESLRDDPGGHKPRLIQLAAEVAHQAEAGWYHSSMKAACEISSIHLNQTQQDFEQHLHRVAISAARANPLQDVLPAAARLIMLPDRDPPVLTETSKPENKPDIKQQVNQLLNSAQSSQVDFIDLLMNHLHDELHMSRVALLLLSSDKAKLGTRAVRGVDETSTINKLVVDTRGSGLLNQILAKPQGLWMQTQNYQKYQDVLPEKFKTSFLQENFLLMSLFISGNPTGVIYCDRANSINKLDKDSYQKFKSVVHLISIALTQLAKRRQRKSV